VQITSHKNRIRHVIGLLSGFGCWNRIPASISVFEH
jgi:hypothetical protein